MPIYEFLCQDCRKVSEFLVGFGEEEILKCKNCGCAELKKIPSIFTSKVDNTPRASRDDGGWEKEVKKKVRSGECEDYKTINRKMIKKELIEQCGADQKMVERVEKRIEKEEKAEEQSIEKDLKGII